MSKLCNSYIFSSKQKDHNVLVLNNSSETIQNNKTKFVQNNEKNTIKGNQSTHIHKNKTETINIASALSIGAGYQVSVGASKNETIGASSTEQVGVIKHTTVGQRYEIKVGNSNIVLRNDGMISFNAKQILVLASKTIELKSDKVCINGGGNGFFERRKYLKKLKEIMKYEKCSNKN